MKDEDLKKLLTILYENLTPKGFEVLLKDMLEKLGFDDIKVTGQSGDSGIDLTATLRKSEIPGIETNVPYKIQAKRFKPDITLNPSYIRELRGSMNSGERGILMTTAKVSRKSIEEESQRDISRVVLVIDGERLINLCMQYEIAIVKQYEVDKEYLNKLESRNKTEIKETGVTHIVATKFVTDNDKRAQILRIPKEIKSMVGQTSTITLYFDESSPKTFNIDKTGTYVGGVIKIFRKYRLVGENGQFFPKISVWGKFKDGFIVKFKDTEVIKAIIDNKDKSTF